jgi:DNA integrity scanning protein DisA with diadenylate cyclase activity
LVAGEEEMMSQGQEQVQATLEICQTVSERVAGWVSGDDSWTTELAERLESIKTILEETQDKFFLRMKLCVPFTSRCEREARRLTEAFAALDAASDMDTEESFDSVLAALEKSVKALEERSAMGGMAIT